jgi:flagellar hook-associated protein 1
MSTFSSLNTAFSGLVAARRGLDVVGQNITNVNTTGYTRQRVETSAVANAISFARTQLAQPGNGVQVTGIARLGDVYADARVRDTAADAAYWNTTDSVLANLEARLNEPSDDGLSATLQRFWSAWQTVSNQPGEAGPAAVLIEEASTLATQLATGYRAAQSEWASVRTQASSIVTNINAAATQVAQLNDQIRQTVAVGGSPNELIDRRDQLAEGIAAQTGASVRLNADGTADVLIGGIPLVEGTTARSLAVTGSSSLEGAPGAPVALEWSHRPGQSVAVGGSLGATIQALAPASEGGSIATFAAGFDRVAQTLADTVNTVHRTGQTADGTTGHDFFTTGPGPAALSLAVVPTDASGIAAGAAGSGALDGSIADRISQLGSGSGSADAAWSAFVVTTGVQAAGAANKASVYSLAATTAADLRQGQAGVDLDEELTNMMTFQRAYQGAARVLTAIDEALDTLINRTGLVGR